MSRAEKSYSIVFMATSSEAAASSIEAMALKQLEAFQVCTQQPVDEQREIVESELTSAMHIPHFISDAEVLQVMDAALLLKATVAPGYNVHFSSSHVALNLHGGGHFAAQQPALQAKILAGMRSEAGWCDPAMPLSVRCIELHSYSVGDGLMTEGHKDHGSVLTMSIQLCHTTEMGGGQLMTWHAGVPVFHAMERGDALLFPSLKTHNVSPITMGSRRSLVIELWRGGTNVKNRYT